MPATSSLSRLQELLPQLFESIQLPGDIYLRFQLTPNLSGLFSMEFVQESLLIPSAMITPLPNMSELVLGLMSSRDRVFCVIDLPQLLGGASLSAYTRQYHIIVVRVNQSASAASEQDLLLGLAVKRIQGITRVMPDSLRSLTPDFPASLTPYLGGYIVEEEETLLVLDPETIVNQALLGNT